MQFELTGVLFERFAQSGTEKYPKKEFIVEVAEQGQNGTTYSQFIRLQCSGKLLNVIDNYQVGQRIKCQFNLKGNKWEKDGKRNYINSLDVWRIEKI